MGWLSRRRGRSTEEGEHAALAEAVHAPALAPGPVVGRRGYEDGIPIGGTTRYNAGAQGDVDRKDLMGQMYGAYLSCPWSSACVDTTARTVTAGGLDLLPDEETEDVHDQAPDPPGVVRLRNLLDYVNPREDIRQLSRGLVTDIEVFGDAFLEVVWLLGEPVALYSLDCPSMITLSDEHGEVTGYTQILGPGQEASFEAHEVIQISMDAPRGGLYGVGSTQKSILSITSWLFTAGLLKETMRKGDPPHLHVDFPLEAAEPDMARFLQKYQTQNMGIANIGNPIMSRGGVLTRELHMSKIAEMLATLTQDRDTILSSYGCPPSKVGVIESGNLGGGTGASQDKTYRVNKCGPLAELVTEKLGFHLLREAFDVPHWRVKFGEVDWRDDKVVEDIRDQRLRNGSWVLNRYRAEIGEPDVEGGNDAVLVDRQNLVLWSDLADLSHAQVTSAEAGGNVPGLPTAAAAAGLAPAAKPTTPAAAAKPGAKAKPAARPAAKPKPKAGETRGPVEEERALVEEWRRDYQRRRRQVLRELPQAEEAA